MGNALCAIHSWSDCSAGAQPPGAAPVAVGDGVFHLARITAHLVASPNAREGIDPRRQAFDLLHRHIIAQRRAIDSGLWNEDAGSDGSRWHHSARPQWSPGNTIRGSKAVQRTAGHSRINDDGPGGLLRCNRRSRWHGILALGTERTLFREQRLLRQAENCLHQSPQRGSQAADTN